MLVTLYDLLPYFLTQSSMYALQCPFTRTYTCMHTHTHIHTHTHTHTSIPLQLQKSTSTPSTTSKPTIIPTTSKARTSFTIEHKSAIPPKHATSRASGWVKTGNPKALEMGTLKHSETTHKASAKKHSCSPQDNQSSKELSFPSGKIVVKQQRRFGSSHCGTSTLLISNPPEIMLQSKQETAQRKIDEVIANKTGTAEKSTKLSTHYKFLMSWENDFFKGSMSTKAPVLYALDTIADKLATRKGGCFFCMLQ